MSINISKSIKVCCAIRDITQTELAERSGLQQSHISYVTKKGSCSFETLEKLAKGLDYKVSEFIEWGED